MKHLFLLLLLSLLPFKELKCEEGNALIVCENSLEMLKWDLKFIEKAEQSIELSVCFTGGSVFRDLMRGCEGRVKLFPKLQVFFLIAPVLLESYEREMIKTFEEKYPQNFHFQYSDSVFEALPDYFAIDNHLKIIVVDEKYYSVGGTNFDEFLCSDGVSTPVRRAGEGIARNTLPGGMRDQDVVGRGPMAREMRILFHKNFALWEHFFRTNELIKDPDVFTDNPFYFPLEKGKEPYVAEFEKSSELIQTPKMKMIFSGPQHVPNLISKEYERLINSAKNEIAVGNLYCCPMDYIFDAFKRAVSRGIALSFITNGLWEQSPTYGNFICWANRVNFAPLFWGREFSFFEYFSADASTLGKTKIYEYRIPDTIFHKKVMVIDRKIAVIGTYNLGKRSDLGDYEVILVIESPEIAKAILKVHERDKSLSEEISPWTAKEWYFDPVKSYMGSVQKLFHGFL